MSSSNLNKKRQRPPDNLTITIGKINHSYYYISDSLSGGNNKIKISMVYLSNPKEENPISVKEHEEENDTSLDILNLSTQILKEEFPKIVNNIKNNETEKIYLPISSSWFSMDNIHEIEIKSLPEYFCGKFPSKTPQVYKNYRNFIINLYRENSTMYLSSNACRKHLAGDACSIMRIHAFLEHWGLINFKLNQKFKPNFFPKAFNFKSPIYIDSNLFMLDNITDKDNSNNNSADNNKNINNIANYNNPESSIVITSNKKKEMARLYPINKISNKLFNNFIDNFKAVNNYIEENPYIDLKKFKKINFLSQNYRPKCEVCGNFCSMEWYITKENKSEEDNDSSNDINVSINIDEKSLKKEFNIICEECFNSDIPLPNDLDRENFELSSIYNLFAKEKEYNRIVDRINNEKWTEEENNKLMEGIKNKKNWDEIIKSFGHESNKTKKECIFHLLQMPLNDDMEEKYKYKDNLDDDDDEEDEDEDEDEDKDKDKDKDKGKDKDNNLMEQEDDAIEPEDILGNNKENDNENENNNNEKNINNDIENNDDNKMNVENNEENKENIEFNYEQNKKMNNMLEIFMRLFKRYLNENENNTNNINSNKDDKGNEKDVNINNKNFKEIIYKTFAKSINKSKELKNEEKNEMKNIVDILVYLQMKKIELKMNYFKQFERVLEFKRNQLKKIETDIIQERIKLITKKLLLQKKQQLANENK